MRLKYYITEADEKIKVVILTTKNDEKKEDSGGDKLFDTSKKIKEYCEKKKISHYVLYAENAFINRNKDDMTVHNSDDKQGFKIHKNNTAVVVRGTFDTLSTGLDLLSRMENAGIFCVNGREAIEICSDKYRTILAMEDNEIKCPKTATVVNKDGLGGAFKRIGGKFPCILKTITGSKGIGVFFADSWIGMNSTLQAMWKVDEEVQILMQEYIEADFDMRIHVLGGEVIGAMKRFKIKNDFRSNYSLGGKIEEMKVNDKLREFAINAAKAIGGIWVGVDVMDAGKEDYRVIEVNSSPGTEGIEKATHKNIVGTVVKFITDKNNWADIKKTECGFVEKIKIEKTDKEFDAKMDTGNSSYSVIHANKWKINGDNIRWEMYGKKYTDELDSMKEVEAGATEHKREERPVIKLNVIFNGETYKNVRFCLSDREDFSTPVLMNRQFIRRAGLIVNPSLKYALSEK
jgi:ribosomal protein S6--L-glutamate ligase